MSKLHFSLGIIVVGLSIGYVIQWLSDAGMVRLPMPLDVLRKLLQKTALLFILPLTVVGAIWIVNAQSLSIAALPLIGVGAITLGGVLALGAARILALEPRQTGALILAARSPTSDPSARDPFIRVALSSIAIGGLLNLSGLARPEIFSTINALFIPLGTGLLLISIGLAMHFKQVRHYLKACGLVASIKFVAVPLFATTVAWSLGYGDINDGLPLKVVMILSAMPVAFNALIPPSLYDLDLNLANACWFTTTSALVIVLPLLLVLIRLV